MEFKRFVCGVVVVACLVTPLAASAGTADDAVDAFVTSMMREQNIPGVSVAVVRGGKVVLAKGYGLANVELSVPATAGTVYHLASLTKQFTAAAVLLLVQDGKLGLDDRVSRYLDPSPPAWSDVTIRQLLTHASGIKDHLNEMNAVTCSGTTPAEIVAHLGQMPLNFTPGTRAAYSNSGYLVLGMVVEKVSGKRFDEFLAERVFTPLGMTHTRRNSVDDIVPNRAAGYVVTDGKLRNSPYVEPTLSDNADSGLVSSVTDLAKWDAALYRDDLLRAASRADMWTPAKLADGSSTEYGFGWLVESVNGHRLVYHGGNRADSATYVARYVDDELTVIVLTNRSGAGAGRIARHVAGIYVPALMAGDAPIDDAEPEVTAVVKTVLLGLQNGSVDAGAFTPEMWKQMIPDVATYLHGLLAPCGKLSSFALLERGEKDGKRWYRYRATFETRSVRVDCTLTKDGKISDMAIGYE